MHVELSVIGSRVMGHVLFSSMAALRTRETRCDLVGFRRWTARFDGADAGGRADAGGAEGAGRAKGAGGADAGGAEGAGGAKGPAVQK